MNVDAYVRYLEKYILDIVFNKEVWDEKINLGAFNMTVVV